MPLITDWPREALDLLAAALVSSDKHVRTMAEQAVQHTEHRLALDAFLNTPIIERLGVPAFDAILQAALIRYKGNGAGLKAAAERMQAVHASGLRYTMDDIRKAALGDELPWPSS